MSVSEELIKKIEAFTMKWCPAGKHKEFLNELGELIQASATDAVNYAAKLDERR